MTLLAARVLLMCIRVGTVSAEQVESSFAKLHAGLA